MKPHQKSHICQVILSDDARKQLLAQYVASGADAAAAAEIIDVAFHAAREAYDRVVEVSAASSMRGATLVLAVELAECIMAETGKAGRKFIEARGGQLTDTTVRVSG